MDVNNHELELKAKKVILSYCHYLLGFRDHHSLALDMRELLFALPPDIRREIQGSEFTEEPKSSPSQEEWEEWEETE